MNIDLELYRIFYCVATVGNITKAAQELCISQPAVTKSIKNLEGQLGGSLFIRTKRGVKLTEEGNVFYQYIKNALEQINNAENKFSQLKNLDTGNIRIGSSATVTKFVLLPYLEKFHRLHPNIDIQIINHLTQDLISQLRNGSLDILVLNLPMKESEDMDILPFKEVNDCFAVNTNYFNLKGPLHMEELNKYPLIMQKKPSNTRSFIDDFALANNITLSPKIEIVSYNLVVDFTKIGLGIGFITKEFAKEELERGVLTEIRTLPRIPTRHIGIVTLKNSLPSFGTRKLIEMITDKC